MYAEFSGQRVRDLTMMLSQCPLSIVCVVSSALLSLVVLLRFCPFILEYMES